MPQLQYNIFIAKIITGMADEVLNSGGLAADGFALK